MGRVSSHEASTTAAATPAASSRVRPAFGGPPGRPAEPWLRRGRPLPPPPPGAPPPPGGGTPTRVPGEGPRPEVGPEPRHPRHLCRREGLSHVGVDRRAPGRQDPPRRGDGEGNAGAPQPEETAGEQPPSGHDRASRAE